MTARGVAQAKQACLTSGQQYLDACVARSRKTCRSPRTWPAKARSTKRSFTGCAKLRPDLVIKSAAGHHPAQRFTLDANDWQLARACPAPLMLTRGRPWNARPKFAAAVDVADSEGASLARSIMQTAGFSQAVATRELDVLFSSALDGGAEAHAARHRPPSGAWSTNFRSVRERTTVLRGDAEDTLPAFAAKEGYDVLVMGALTRRHGLSRLLGTLTSKLVDALDCDFVLVKSASEAQTQVAARAAHA